MLDLIGTHSIRTSRKSPTGSGLAVHATMLLACWLGPRGERSDSPLPATPSRCAVSGRQLANGTVFFLVGLHTGCFHRHIPAPLPIDILGSAILPIGPPKPSDLRHLRRPVPRLNRRLPERTLRAVSAKAAARRPSRGEPFISLMLPYRLVYLISHWTIERWIQGTSSIPQGKPSIPNPSLLSVMSPYVH